MLPMPTLNEGNGPEAKTLLEQIENLYFSQEFARLDQAVERFDIFRIMGVSRDELVHSNVIGALLNPLRTGRIGEEFLSHFLKRIRSLPRLNTSRAPHLSFADLVSLAKSSVNVGRELALMDVRKCTNLSMPSLQQLRSSLKVNARYGCGALVRCESGTEHQLCGSQRP